MAEGGDDDDGPSLSMSARSGPSIFARARPLSIPWMMGGAGQSRMLSLDTKSLPQAQFKFLEHWLIHTSILLGASGAATTFAVNHLLGLPFNGPLLYASFYLYWAAYLGDRLKDCRSAP